MPGRFTLLLLLPLVLALAACKPDTATTDPALQSPRALLSAATEQGLKNVFANPSAHALLESADASALAAATETDAAAITTPSQWRRLDREKRFDGVLLAGPTNEFTLLLHHLLDSPDFRLVRVDNWGVLFTRQRPAPYTPPAVESFEKQFPDAGIRAQYLSQMALMLDAAQFRPEGSRYLAEAMELAPDSAIVRARAGALAFAHGKYGDALVLSSQALEREPKNAAALEVRARAYDAMGAATRAWETAEALVAAKPDDMAALFLHARMANTAHAYQSEQRSLERLIELAGKRGLPTTDYHVYLGQCFAKQGLARPALEQLELAAKDTTLDEARRKDIETAISTIRSRTGMTGE